MTAQTLALEARQFEKFQLWCKASTTNFDLLVLFNAVPQFLVEALKSHAEWLFSNGGTLSNLRHLILAAQRWVLSARVFIAPAWELVKMWETLCPVRHRTPVSETLVCAMRVLARMALEVVVFGRCNRFVFLWSWRAWRSSGMFPRGFGLAQRCL